MMLEESLGADERVIQSMAQKMVGLLGQDLDIDFASPNDGMYGGLGVLTFSAHEIMGRTGELKETSELLDRFLLDQACQKADLFQQRKLSFGSYDILGGIAGVVCIKVLSVLVSLKNSMKISLKNIKEIML